MSEKEFIISGGTKPTNIINYRSTATTFKRLFGDDFVDVISTQPQKVIKEIKKEYPNIKSAKSHISRIVKFLRDQKKAGKPIRKKIIDYYYIEMMDLGDQITDEYGKSNMSVIQKRNWMKWDDIIKIREELRDGIKNAFDYKKYLIVCLYTYIPPIRLDFADMKVIKNDKQARNKDTNYIVFAGPETSKFIINNYKTRKFYGKVEIPIPVKLFDIIRVWFARFNKNMKFLLIARKNKPMHRNNLQMTLARIFLKFKHKRVTPNMFRHSFLTDIMPKLYKNGTHEQRTLLAKLMMHSHEKQSEYVKTKKPTQKLNKIELIDQVMQL